MDKRAERIVNKMKVEGWDEDYIVDWLRVYEATGLDMRDMCDGMDVDAFLDAYEEGDLDAMIMLS